VRRSGWTVTCCTSSSRRGAAFGFGGVGPQVGDVAPLEHLEDFLEACGQLGALDGVGGEGFDVGQVLDVLRDPGLLSTEQLVVDQALGGACGLLAAGAPVLAAVLVLAPAVGLDRHGSFAKSPQRAEAYATVGRRCRRLGELLTSRPASRGVAGDGRDPRGSQADPSSASIDLTEGGTVCSVPSADR